MMIIGVLKLTVHIHDSASLKAKRHVLKSLKDKIKHRFNVSVAEIGSQDKWQLSELAIVAAGSDGPVINATLDKILDLIEGGGTVDITESNIEIINM